MTRDQILNVFAGSNGDATRQMYSKLEALGLNGYIAMNLLRISKVSSRAKQYRGRYRGAGYDTKDWSIGLICDRLSGPEWNTAFGLTWGWGYDKKAVQFEHVLYIDLPTGQVSFHCPRRHAGPDYPGTWDGAVGTGSTRIIEWAASLFTTESSHDRIVPPALA